MTPRQTITDIAFEDFKSPVFTGTIIACLAEAVDCLAQDDPMRQTIVDMIVRAKESRRRA
jgi:hypothetical protein